MAQNLTQPSPYVDEIDLRELIKILIESKKLIISTILIFTITSIIYSLSLKTEFKSSSLFEIGYFEMLDGTQQLIVEPSEIIKDMELHLIIKNPDKEFNQTLSMLPIQNKLIEFKTKSFSSETNEKLLNKFFSYIDDYHASYVKSYNQNKKNDLYTQIDLIESEIKLQRFNNANIIKKNITTLKFLDQKISQLREIIADNQNILFLLQNDPQLLIERATISPNLNSLTNIHINRITQLELNKNSLLENNNMLELENNLTELKEQIKTLEVELESVKNLKIKTSGPIKGIKTTTVKPKTQLIISMGIIMGFIAGILLVIIINFIKSFKENEA